MPHRQPPYDLPPYSYASGLYPHPVSDPAGHSFRLEVVDPPLEGLDDPRAPIVFQWGVTLFDAGYYWESHEAWEAIWLKTTEQPLRDKLKGLIKLAAAAVKGRERRINGVRRHLERALVLLESPLDTAPIWLSWEWPRLCQDVAQLVMQPQQLLPQGAPMPVAKTMPFALGDASIQQAELRSSSPDDEDTK